MFWAEYQTYPMISDWGNPWQHFSLTDAVSSSRARTEDFVFSRQKHAHTQKFHLPPSRKACPVSTGITKSGNTPHIPTRIVAGMVYSQASFFTKIFDRSGRNLHGSNVNQLESVSARVVFAFRGTARWIFTIAVSEMRTDSHRNNIMESQEIFAIMPASLWRPLTPHINFRTFMAICWCFGVLHELEPAVQYSRSAKRAKKSTPL